MDKKNLRHDTNYHDDCFTTPSFGDKSQPITTESNRNYSLIDEEIALPAAVIKASLLDNNLQWMQRFANHHNVKLAPHGKTTMTPAFFRQQLEHGAWGITIASPAQAQIAVLSGAKNIIMANQLVGRANMMIISQLIKHYDVDFYCSVDSKRNVEALKTSLPAMSKN